jgi:hypothetical protein
MPTGLQVISDSGHLQISDAGYNFALRFSGNVTLGATTDSSLGSATATLSYVGSPPIVAIQSTSPCAIAFVNTTGNTHTVTISGTIVGSVVKVFIFDRPAPNAAGFGLEVRDASNNVVFSSDAKLMKIAATVSTSFATPQVTNYPSDRVYAFVPTTMPRRDTWSHDTPSIPAQITSRSEVGMVTMVSNTLTTSKYNGIRVYDSNPSYTNGVYGSYNMTGFMVDVTGY